MVRMKAPPTQTIIRVGPELCAEKPLVIDSCYRCTHSAYSRDSYRKAVGRSLHAKVMEEVNNV